MSTYWDLTNKNLSTEEIKAAQNASTKYYAKLEKWKHNGPIFQFLLVSWLVLAILLFIGGFLMMALQFYHLDNFIYAGIGFVVLIFATIFSSIYFGYVNPIKRAFIMLLVAKRFNWLFDPTIYRNRYTTLKSLYPQIFSSFLSSVSPGTIREQFWGEFDNNSIWIGCYEYLGYTPAVGFTRNTSFKTVFAFRLLNPATKDILLHSNELDKLLTSETNDLLVSKQTIQLLIKFRDSFQPFDLLIKNDVMLLSYRGRFEFKYTNFFKKIELDRRDEENLSKTLSYIINISQEILLNIK